MRYNYFTYFLKPCYQFCFITVNVDLNIFVFSYRMDIRTRFEVLEIDIFICAAYIRDLI